MVVHEQMLVYLAFLVLLRQVFVLVRLYPSPFIFSTALDLQLPQLLIKQLSQLQEELDRRNLPTLLLELNVFLVLGGQSDFFWLELQVIEELLQKMLHQVHDAHEGRIVVTGRHGCQWCSRSDGRANPLRTKKKGSHQLFLHAFLFEK